MIKGTLRGFNLTETALRRPITVSMLVISLLGLGAVAYLRTPVEFLPRFDMPFIGVFIPYPGATPAQVENEIAIPAEGQFRTVSHLKRITTISDSNGCNVNLLFDLNADMGSAMAEVRDRIERLKLDLPDEIDQLAIRRFNSDTLPVVALSLYREGDEEELAHLVRTRLEPRLMRLDGVADVEVFSRPAREVLIEFEQNRLQAANLSIYSVVDQLRASSVKLSAGEIQEGLGKQYVRVQGEFTKPEQYEQIIIGPNALKVRDVANVTYRARETPFAFQFDGKSSALLMIRKESQANAVATCRDIIEELEVAKNEPQFEGMDMFVFFNQGEVITNTLASLINAGKYGGVLALMVLFLFLLRLRPTLIVALAIPVSLVAGFTSIFVLGMSLNLVTMVSMIIAIGMLVDNSIVVIENITRHHQMGDGPVDSALLGAKEVGMAITASTFTTVVVFVPTIYLEQGEMALYMQQFAVPVTVSLLASLVLALTVIPLAASKLKRREDTNLYKRVLALIPGGQRSTRRAMAPFRGLTTVYERLLGWTVRRRLAAVVLVALVFGITLAGPAGNIGVKDMPTVDSREVQIDVKMAQNFDMERASKVMSALTEAIDPMREELGIRNIFRYYDTSSGRINVYLRPLDDYPEDSPPKYNTDEALNILWQRLPDQIPGAEIQFRIPDATEQQSQDLTLRMRGHDIDVLERNARAFKDLLEDLPAVASAEVDAEKASQEIQLAIDEPLVEEAGISPMVLAQTVDFALRGIRLPYMKQEGREIPVWAQFQEEDRKSRANLENVSVPAAGGRLIPLNRLVDFNRARSPRAIMRVDGKNVVTITARANTENTGAVLNQVRGLASQFEMPQGYDIQLGDQFMELDTNIANFVTAAMLSSTLIYIVMGALFESFVLPLSILWSLPLAAVGVIWAMFLTGTDFDTVALIGIILMMGIVVNNGIVIVDHINRLRGDGLNRYEAVLQAGRDRFRPVLMTATTTILGCVPLALGGGMVGSKVSFASMGWSLIGGLSVGTLLTLFIVPLFYTLIDDVRQFSMDFFGSLLGLTRKNGDPAK